MGCDAATVKREEFSSLNCPPISNPPASPQTAGPAMMAGPVIQITGAAAHSPSLFAAHCPSQHRALLFHAVHRGQTGADSARLPGIRHGTGRRRIVIEIISVILRRNHPIAEIWMIQYRFWNMSAQIVIKQIAHFQIRQIAQFSRD